MLFCTMSFFRENVLNTFLLSNCSVTSEDLGTFFSLIILSNPVISSPLSSGRILFCDILVGVDVTGSCYK